jgi:5'-methylthioadenosine phosphorylase
MASIALVWDAGTRGFMVHRVRMSVRETIGVIGGSGLYEIGGLADVRSVRVETPFGSPSDELVVGRLGECALVFLPRHGRGHRFLPHEINYRANLHALRQLGASAVISVSAVGSMREAIRPGDLVIVDQFFDRTYGRAQSFFGDGIAGHIPFADPICPRMAARLFGAAREATQAAGRGAHVHHGGTYLVINGPQFSTRAESKIFRSWGVDVIGMTNLPEARLARELGLCYATIALATDYDCWHEAEADVSVAAVVEVMQKNVACAKDAIARAASAGMPAGPCGCAQAAAHAVMTERSRWPQATATKLALVFGAGAGDAEPGAPNGVKDA